MPVLPEVFFTIEIPKMEVEVGVPQTVIVKIKNVTDFLMKYINATSEISDSELMGTIPYSLKPKESFDMQLTLAPREWNPDGIQGKILITAKMVSR